MKRLACILALILALAAPALAQQEGQVPVKITADKMTYSENAKTVTFEGNVEVVRQEMKLWCDTLTAHFSGSKPKPGQKPGQAADIETITATGRVRVEMNGRKGTCGKLVYHVEDGIMEMQDNPSLTENRNTISGKVIKFYLKDDRSEVLGGKNKRVEATFFTPEDIGDKGQ